MVNLSIVTLVYLYIIYWYPLHGGFSSLLSAVEVTPSPKNPGGPGLLHAAAAPSRDPEKLSGCHLCWGVGARNIIYTHIYISYIIIYIYVISYIVYNRFHIIWVKYLVGGWPTPLKNMSLSVGVILLNISKNKSHVPNTQPDNIIGAVAMLAGDFFQVVHVFVVFSLLHRLQGKRWPQDIFLVQS